MHLGRLCKPLPRLARAALELGERLMRYLYDKLPQLEGQVDYYEVSTPLSTEWFSGYRHGELYGLDHTPVAGEDFTPFPFSSATSFDGEVVFAGYGIPILAGKVAIVVGAGQRRPLAAAVERR